MMKKTKLILLFMLVLPLVLSLSNIQVEAGRSLTGFESNELQGTLIGSNMTSLQYCFPDGECIPFVNTVALYVLTASPMTMGPDQNGNYTYTLPEGNYRTFSNSSFCIGEGNPYVGSGGTSLYTCNSTALLLCKECQLPCGDGK